MKLIRKEWCLFLLCLVGVLCVYTSLPLAQERNEETCLQYFAEIMETQKLREILRFGADQMIERYERGELDKKSLDSTLAMWHTTESELRQKVTKLYDTAYAEKCFENESKRTKTRNAPEIQGATNL